MGEQTRRDFLKMIGIAAGSVIVPGIVFGKQKQRRPNVVLIFTDDQGTVDVNCYGAKDLLTPNLDRLAREGTRFTQFYVGAPVCSPSRAALMTGRYPQRAGQPSNAPSQRGHAGMPTEQVTIAEVLKAAGYATGHVGKWHLGYTPETMPNGQGYDSSFGHMGGCIDNYSHFFYWQGPNRHDLWRNGEEIWRDGEFFGELMVDECKKFIDENKDDPFLLYWAINMPHYPLQGTEKWRKKYPHLDAPRRMYAAFVSTMDEMIGNVVAHLDKLGLREDTIIIWLSDHGHSVEQRTFGGGGSSGDFRGHKFTLWEGGIRVFATKWLSVLTGCRRSLGIAISDNMNLRSTVKVLLQSSNQKTLGHLIRCCTGKRAGTGRYARVTGNWFTMARRRITRGGRFPKSKTS
ncbi:MAG: sulfatase-like hydrolase/transferase [Planctomycetota bacterium]|jgi:arylsulfatase A-like enzyme